VRKVLGELEDVGELVACQPPVGGHGKRVELEAWPEARRGQDPTGDLRARVDPFSLVGEEGGMRGAGPTGQLARAER